MISAFISDIHGNLTALEVAMDYIHSLKPDRIFCLGDIVGYGPKPNECVSLVRENCDQVLMGNHDYAAINLLDTRNFNPNARYAMDWTRSALNSESLNFLKKLPFTVYDEDILMAHSSPKNPSYWHYVLSVNEASEQIHTFKQHVCFIGHSHLPVVFSATQMYDEEFLLLDQDEKYIINVGSVGQPRDHNPDGCLVIYDSEKQSIEYIRFAYDIKRTQNEIRQAGLPDFLADRLIKGI